MFRGGLSAVVLLGFVLLGFVLLGFVLLGGCGGDEVDPEQASVDLDALQERVVATTETVLSALEGVGLVVEKASGVAETCRMQPSPGATYRAGGVVDAGEAEGQNGAATDALVDAGWSVEDQGGAPDPFAVLTQEDLRVSLGVARRQDIAGQVTFGVTGPCVDTTDAGLPPGGERDQVIR